MTLLADCRITIRCHELVGPLLDSRKEYNQIPASHNCPHDNKCEWNRDTSRGSDEPPDENTDADESDLQEQKSRNTALSEYVQRDGTALGRTVALETNQCGDRVPNSVQYDCKYPEYGLVLDCGCDEPTITRHM